MRLYILSLAYILVASSCQNLKQEQKALEQMPQTAYIYVLGIAQDAGYPQANCQKECCSEAWINLKTRKHATSLALVDPATNQYWLFEATPDFKYQLRTIQEAAQTTELPNGIFLTHGHIGHYSGLMHLGKEVIGAKAVNTYVMPRMKMFLTTNGPWSQLVAKENISLISLRNNEPLELNAKINVTPFTVPHRDEFTETVEFKIVGPHKSLLFIPDIDKWEKWEKNIIEETKKVDLVLIDGTFFADGEIPGRDMSAIPHPFIQETMSLFKQESDHEKNKVWFIHFNHTNPTLKDNSKARKEIEENGFNICYEGQIIKL